MTEKVYYSEVLNDLIRFNMVPRLSDEDLTKLNYELLELNTSLRERLKVLKAMDLPEYEMDQFVRATKKHIIVEQFKTQVSRELERRFQKSQELTKDEIHNIVFNRQHLLDYKVTKKTLDCMCDILRHTYGESVVSTIHKQAREEATLNVIQ